MSVFCKFADHKKIIDLKTLIDKKIDETKQGNVLTIENQIVGTKKLYIESYGCQMNFSDSEIVASILSGEGFKTTQNIEEAEIVLVNTCSIREKAEQTVRKRLKFYNSIKKEKNPNMLVGVLGCMAQNLKNVLLKN